MTKMMLSERYRQELSFDASTGCRNFLVVEQSSFESHSRRCAKTSIFTVYACCAVVARVQPHTQCYHKYKEETTSQQRSHTSHLAPWLI